MDLTEVACRAVPRFHGWRSTSDRRSPRLAIAGAQEVVDQLLERDRRRSRGICVRARGWYAVSGRGGASGALLALALSMLGCASAGRPAPDAGRDAASARDAGRDAGARDAGHLLDAATTDGGSMPVPFAEGTVVCESLAADGGTCCPADRLRAPPRIAASVLDLSDLEPGAPGTCGAYTTPARAISLPTDPEAYPLKIVLPARAAADPACETLCAPTSPDQSTTAFGVAIDTSDLIGGFSNRVLAISVPPPWFFTSGGCGEACAWPCLGGYLEFGVQSCITMAYGDFGLATHDPNAPSVEVVVDLVDTGGVSGLAFAPEFCCLYAATAE